MRAAIVALLVAGCAGCSSEAPKEHRIVLSPDPALASVTAEWASRWSAATGLPIAVAPGGIPVVSVAEAPHDGDGTPPCGATESTWYTDGTFVATERVMIDMTPPDDCAGWGYTLGHELAHVIAPGFTHTPDGLLEHSTDLGVVHKIDAEALAAVCAVVDCPAFEPER